MKPSRNFKKPERGQSLVELTLIIVILLLLVIGVADFGVGFFHWMALRDAAQEGAIFASLMPTETGEIFCRIRTADLIYTPANRLNRLSPYTDPDCANAIAGTDTILNDTTIVISGQTCRGITDGKVNSVTVTLTYDYEFLFPIPTALLGGSATNLDHATLKAEVTNTVLYPECVP